jgi:hypothetical protein
MFIIYWDFSVHSLVEGIIFFASVLEFYKIWQESRKNKGRIKFFIRVTFNIDLIVWCDHKSHFPFKRLRRFQVNNFKIKNLIGVLIVSATVLLTGCKKLDSVGKFGESLSILNTGFDAVYDDVGKVCAIQFEINRLATEIAPNYVYSEDTDLMELTNFEEMKKQRIEKLKELERDITEEKIGKDLIIVFLKDKINDLNELLKKPEKQQEMFKAGEKKKKDLLEAYSFSKQLEKCEEMEESFEKIKLLPKTLGKFGTLINSFNNLEYDKFEETRNALYNLPNSVLAPAESESKEPFKFESGMLNNVIDSIFAFIPEAIMRDRIIKELKEFIKSSDAPIKGTLSFLEDGGLVFLTKNLDTIIGDAKSFGGLLKDYSSTNLDPSIILIREKVVNDLSYLKSRKELLEKYKKSIQEISKAHIELVREAKKNKSNFEGEELKSLMNKLLTYVKSLNLKA